MKNKYNHVIILDVDNTLVHAVDNHNLGNLCSHNDVISTPNYNVYIRPNLYRFLDYCFSITPYVILWSAGNFQYISEITKYIFKNYEFYSVITMDTFGTIYKNVNWICDDLNIKNSVIIFIDDIPERIVRSENTVIITIHPFQCHEKLDEHLIKMSEMIDLIINN